MSTESVTIIVRIPDRDVLVGAMVRGLATQIDGYGGNPPTLAQAKNEFLLEYGHLELHLSTLEKANKFKAALNKYLSSFVEVD